MNPGIKWLSILFFTSAVTLLLITGCAGTLNVLAGQNSDWSGVSLRAGDDIITFDYGVHYRKSLIDERGSVYLIGMADAQSDVDPGRDYVVSLDGGYCLVVLKIDEMGNTMWVRTWDNPVGFTCHHSGFTPDGNLMITGSVTASFDMDPGDDQDIFEAVDRYNMVTLVLNPDGEYVHGFGSNHRITDACQDGQGNLYVTGTLEYGTPDLDPGPGEDVFETFRYNVYVSKFSPDGTYIWSRVWDWTPDVNIPRIAADSEGNLFIAGQLKQVIDLDPSDETCMEEPTGNNSDIFIVKLDPEGNFSDSGIWRDSHLDHQINDIATDSSGRVLIAGSGIESYPMGGCCWGRSDQAFIACFDNQLELEYDHIWGVHSVVNTIEVDPGDIVYLQGTFSDPDTIDIERYERELPDENTGDQAGDGGYYTTEEYRPALIKLDQFGNMVETRIWEAQRRFASVATDSEGVIYLTSGEFIRIGKNDPVMEAGAVMRRPDYTIEPSVEWVTYIGKQGYTGWDSSTGSGLTNGTLLTDICMDTDGGIYIVGMGGEPVDFDPGPDEMILPTEDIDCTWGFLAKYSVDGEFQWARSWLHSIIRSCTIHPSGDVLITGTGTHHREMDLDPGIGPNHVDQRVKEGIDGFACRLTPDGDYVWGKLFGHENEQHGDVICADCDGNIYIIGRSAANTGEGFEGDMDFDPVPGVYESTWRLRTFLVKLNSDGEIQWSRDWSGSTSTNTYWQTYYGLVTDSANNVYIAASGGYVEDIDLDPGEARDVQSCDGYLLSLTTDGEYRWGWPYDGQLEPHVQRLDLTPDGNVMLFGIRRCEISSYGGFVAEFDESGQEIMSSNFDGQNYRLGMIPYDMAVCPDGRIAIAATRSGFLSCEGAFNRSETATIHTYDSTLMMLDSTGTLESFRYWGVWNYVNKATAVEVDDDGNIYLAGITDGLFLMKIPGTDL